MPGEAEVQTPCTESWSPACTTGFHACRLTLHMSGSTSHKQAVQPLMCSGWERGFTPNSLLQNAVLIARLRLCCVTGDPGISRKVMRLVRSFYAVAQENMLLLDECVEGDNRRHKCSILVTHLVVVTIQLSSYANSD